jgi:hypothetical protein
MIMAVTHSIALALRFAMHVGVNMADGPMLMGMNVEVARTPPVQQPNRERDNDDADDHLRSLLQHARQRSAEEHDRKPKQSESSGMAESPCQAQPRRSTGPTLLLVQEQGRHRCQVIGIEGVPKPEDQRNDKRERHRDIIPWARSEITDIVPSRRIDSRP